MNDPVGVQCISGEDALAAGSGRLVDLVDGLLKTGVVIRGDLTISVADIDLIFLGLQLVITDPDALQSQEDAA